MFGPAAIGTLHPRKIIIEDQNDSTVPELFFQVIVCIGLLLMRYLSLKIYCQTLKLNRFQNLMHRSEIMFLEFLQDFAQKSSESSDSEIIRVLAW